MSEPRSDLTSPPKAFKVMGISIHVATTEQAAERIVRAARARKALEVHLCNAYTLACARKDPTVRNLLVRGDLNLADGTSIVMLGRHAKQRRPVRGSDLLRAVVDIGRPAGLRHYLFGGGSGVASLLAQNLERLYPGAQVVAPSEAPFLAAHQFDIASLTSSIRQARASIVWIGLGTPKQDRLVPLIASPAGVPVIPVGAAFDFLTGQVNEAPKIAQDLRIEWLFRLAAEPRRLWKRYLFDSPAAIAFAVADRWRKQRD